MSRGEFQSAVYVGTFLGIVGGITGLVAQLSGELETSLFVAAVGGGAIGFVAAVAFIVALETSERVAGFLYDLFN